MNLFHALIKSSKVEHANRKPAVEEDEVPTVILDASFLPRRARMTQGNTEEQNSTRKQTFPQR